MGRKVNTKAKDLPGEIVVEGFDAVYFDYIKGGTNPFWFLYILSWAIIAVGFITMIFGPSSIMVNKSQGLSLLQFVQLYPGPIVTAGFVALSVSAWLNGSANNSLYSPEEYFENHVDWVIDDYPSASTSWQVMFLGNDVFEVYSDPMR
jgi:hypothetical protein